MNDIGDDSARRIDGLTDVESGEVVRQYSTSEVLEYAVPGSFKLGRLLYDAV